jgi:hypothetical protein
MNLLLWVSLCFAALDGILIFLFLYYRRRPEADAERQVTA